MDGKDKEAIARSLEETRRRTVRLLEPLDDHQLTTQHDPLMSPPIWDYAHIGAFEELWLVRALSGGGVLDDDQLRVYDALETPRVVRRYRRLLDRAEAESYLAEVRRRALTLLEEVDLHADDPLVRDGFVYDLVVQHEQQHGETILQTVQLMPGRYLAELPPLPPFPTDREVGPSMVEIPGGTYPIGTDLHEPYDNEHPRHLAQLAAYAIDRFPVTNGEYLAFMEDGGYRRRELWSEEGWEWNQTFGTGAPEYWVKQGSTWLTTCFGCEVPVDSRSPVMHVCYFEAEAYARWAGKRLPTEFEWEVAAGWDPVAGRRRRYPWGDDPPTPARANLDQRQFRPLPVGSFPQGASAFGCEQMLGDVWEWTSSDFRPYPGFVAYPYREYSEPFFSGGFKVLRGGSWATRPEVARVSFRNWDSRLRRQIFAGLRCAVDLP